MRITNEADYALQIAYLLAKEGRVMDAGSISRTVGVTDSFTFKILHKLNGAGIVSSRKGSSGGYELSVDPCEVSMKRVIEIIDGPIEISRCLDRDCDCSRVGKNKHECVFHLVFAKLNRQLAERLDAVTLDMVLGDDVDIKSILSKI